LLLPAQIERLQTLLDTYTPQQIFGSAGCAGDGRFWTVPDLRRLVEREFGVLYKSDTSYRLLFDKCDFSYQRPAGQYKSRSEPKYMEFEE
jgi:transposase